MMFCIVSNSKSVVFYKIDSIVKRLLAGHFLKNGEDDPFFFPEKDDRWRGGGADYD